MGVAYVPYSISFHIPASHRNTNSHYYPARVKFNMIDTYRVRPSGDLRIRCFLLDCSGSSSTLPVGCCSFQCALQDLCSAMHMCAHVERKAEVFLPAIPEMDALSAKPTMISHHGVADPILWL